MRRSKFVELASAYLDGELSADEVELLRRELNDNPGHRALFASYKRMNDAAFKAKFPVVDIKPAAGYRHSFLVSSLSWCVAGSFAGVMAVFVFFAASRHSSRMEEQLVAMDVAKEVVVTNEAGRTDKELLPQQPSSSAMRRTPVQALLADSGFQRNSKEPFKNAYASTMAEDPLERALANRASPYSFARANPVTQPNSSLCTPVSFVSMTEH